MALIGFVWSFSAYRAATQGFTIDEAYTYALYVGRSFEWMAREYDACNHVLHTILTKASAAAFGTSELALRLPSLLGCGFYLAAVYRLVSLAGAGSLLHPVACGVMTLNPLVLDLMAAARGYGLALALFAWSSYHALLYLTVESWPRRLRYAGMLAGLAVAANLTFLVPVTALTSILVITNWRNGFRIADHFVLPAVMCGFLPLALPLTHAQPANFYAGLPSFAQSVELLWDNSLLHTPERWWPSAAVRSLEGIRLPSLGALLAAIIIYAALAFWRYTVKGRRDIASAAPFLFGGTLALSLTAILAGHELTGLAFPYGRGGLFLIYLFSMTLVLSRWATGALIVLVAAYLAQLETRYFGAWRFDAATRDVMRIVREKAGRPPVSVGGSWIIEPTVNYYRMRHRISGMKPMPREGTTYPGYDYYVLIDADQDVIDRLGLHVLYSDRLSGMSLAAKP